MIRPFSSKAWMQWTVALTGMNARADNPGPGLAVARSLARGPFRGSIIGLGYDALDPGLHAPQFVDRGFLLPYPSEGPTALRERLEELMAQTRFDAIIPSLDAELPNFIAIADWLAERGVRMLIPSAAQLRRRDKDRLPELCAAAGVAAPECRRIYDPAVLERIDEIGFAYPVVLKGQFYDAYVVYSPGEAQAAFHRIAATWGYPILVQPFIAGHEVNLCGLADASGALVAQVSMRKRALTDKGKAWAGITIVDPDLEAMARQLIAILEWRGPFEVEALRDVDGKLHLIEINPRFPAWVCLSAGAGCNMPAKLLRLLAGENEVGAAPAPAGVCFIRYADEVILSLEELESITVLGESARPHSRGARAALV